MQKAFRCLVALFTAKWFSLAIASAAHQEAKSMLSFPNFVNHYGRSYAGGTKEYEDRKALFQARAHAVHEHNRKADRRWTATVNKFSDRTDAELASFRGWRRRGSPTELMQQGTRKTTSSIQSVGGLSLRQEEHGILAPALSNSVSWAFLNASSRHYNQGACGSCWAIASAVLLEYHSEVHGRDRTFSAQELVSCVPNPQHCGGSGGCEGATMELAMEWVMKHGLADDSEVPYSALDGECQADAKQTGSSLLQIHSRAASPDLEEAKFDTERTGSSASNKLGLYGWERLPTNDYQAVLHALQDGPVGVSVAASDWFSYYSGIFDECVKDAIIDHAVVLIGYGSQEGDPSEKYWLLKNSWGDEWGEGGLMRLARRHSQEDDEGSWCGIDNQPELGSGCDGGPSQVTVCGTCGILYDTVVPHFHGESGQAKRKAVGHHSL